METQRPIKGGRRSATSYMPPAVKEYVRRLAREHGRSLSMTIAVIVTDACGFPLDARAKYSGGTNARRR